ncbi:sensor histidine kinase [Actinoplanes oblitus]|uniref:histidine kinase n=1 Tax=Actinoplanes oblitus TaxID=3040509 RepID=A0ABY8W777_9ACTN|nr:sensor histidine kinase [Actinoplanes oblitus]WIM93182.1 sensor histidine kinase [Actinoplanes oblitus]
MPRRFLTDAALALALLLLTLGPAYVPRFLDDQKSSGGGPSGTAWWVLAGLVMAGLLIRQPRPVLALALTGAGAFGHLLMQTKFQLLDLALPLVVYTVAATVRRRRVALSVLLVVMLLTYAAMLGGRVRTDSEALRNGKAQKVVMTTEAPDKAAKTMAVTPAEMWANAMIDSSQAVLELWLLMVAAFAVGDGMRSRRAHLAAVEQRTADLAREERQRAALAVATERARITRELHDVVAHGMSVMVVQAQGAAAALDRHPESTATALRHVIETGRSSLAEMRRLLAANRAEPAGLAPLPGIGTVPALVDQLRLAGMRIDLHIDGVPEVVPAAVDLSAYRIVQEALTNTLKHAGPDAAAEVRVRFEPDCLRVEVLDDGPGPAAGADGHGSGLHGIAERVGMLGGALETGRGPGGGFRLGASLPVSP